MEVIAICGDRHCQPDVVVRLTHRELLLITHGSPYKTVAFFSTQKLDIHARFMHANSVLAKIESAKKTSGQLRALADTLELAFPTLEEIAAEPGSEVTA